MLLADVKRLAVPDVTEAVPVTPARLARPRPLGLEVGPGALAGRLRIRAAHSL
jgi:hypothetical protein